MRHLFPLLLALLPLQGCLGSQRRTPDQLKLGFSIGAKTPITRFDLMADRPVSFQVGNDGRSCWGSAGFSAFVPAALVQILDQDGVEIGKGTLGQGRVGLSSPDPQGHARYDACHYKVQLPLTRDAKIYTIRINNESYVRRVHVSELARLKGVIHYTTD